MTKRKGDRPVWLLPKKLVDPATGEEIGCLVPAHRFDGEALRAMKLRPGEPIRADLWRRRNPRFFRLAHALGRMVAENSHEFDEIAAAKDWHAAVKKLQRDSGIACEHDTVDVPGFGTLTVKTPKSLAFDRMDEAEFAVIFTSMCEYIRGKYWPTMTPEQIGEQALLIAGER